MPSANAPIIAASPMGWSRRSSRWPRSAPTISPSAASSRYAGSAVSTKLKVTGIDVFSVGDFGGGDDSEEIVLSDPGAGVYRKLVLRDDRLVGGVLYGDTVRRRVVFQAPARRHQRGRDARPAHVRRDQRRRHRTPRSEQHCRDGGRHGGLRLQWRMQGRDRQGDQGEGTLHAGGSAQAHQGVELLRLVHRAGRADPDQRARRRLLGRGEAEAAVRLHRPHASGGARHDPRAPPAHDPRRLSHFWNGERRTAARPAGRR